MFSKEKPSFRMPIFRPFTPCRAPRCIWRRPGILARIETIGSGNHLQKQRVVGDCGGDRASMIDRGFDWASRRYRGRDHALPSCRRRRNRPTGYDRAALIAADGHVGLAGCNQRRGSGGRAARCIAHAIRIMDRPGSDVWLPPERQKCSQVALPRMVPPASRMRVTTVASAPE